MRSEVGDVDWARSVRFANPTDAYAFLTGRWLARLAAAFCAGVDPSRVAVSRHCPDCGGSDHGRPTACPGPASLSSSRRRGLVAAVAAPNPVAVDVELWAERHAVPSSALTASERAHAGPGGRLRLWTRKECLVKLGLCSLDEFGLIDAGDPAADRAVALGVFLQTHLLGDHVVTVASIGAEPPVPVRVVPWSGPPVTGESAGLG